jgi:serine/threonine protein phosphatase PrpC
MERPELVEAGALEVAVYTSARNRPNEDAAALFVDRAGRVLLVVADGAGGEASGAKASELAVRCFGNLEHADRESLLHGFDEAQRSVVELGIGAATTLAVVLWEEGAVRSFHAGDSDVRVVGQRGRRKLEIVPHSVAGYAVEAGLVDENEALHHDERHIVTNVIGSTSMRVEMSSRCALARRDTLLLATDGLSDNMLPEEVVGTIRKGALGRAAENLVARARQRMDAPREGEPSKPDDLTLLLARRRA